MPRAKIPEGELVQFIVKTRYHSSQAGDPQKQLTLIRNLAAKLFRDHVGYTLEGRQRLKGKGEPVFSRSVARDKRREGKSTVRTEETPPAFLKYLGDGAFLWEGSRNVVIGIPGAVKSVDRVDYVLADRFSPALREPLLELLGQLGATLVGPPETVQEATLRGLKGEELLLGGALDAGTLQVHGVPCVSSEDLAPLGFVVEMDGITLYHPGRSCLTAEMQAVGDQFRVDVMTVRLGKRLPMSFWAATRAAEWTEARWVVPWTAERGILPKELQKHLGDMARVRVLGPNERWPME